ncbi:MAG: acyl-ACP desaturase [Chloroflexi bacterium]|nr:acyl-ACP desaturase [Chloroflexota bacterium]MCI0650143.1 acyl-ACP desaturase [Chloroflexota bacterium]MCI0731384.1 acyl-ACP desaturase [Chloroflexota bacterium]
MLPIKPEDAIVEEIEEQRPPYPAGLLSKREKDRLIERGTAGLYRWYLARSQAKRNWNPDYSFDWRSLRTDHSPELNMILEGYYAVEQYVPDYTSKTIQMTRQSYGRSQFQIRWGAEEEKHADLWLNSLLFSRFRAPAWIEEYKQSLRTAEWPMPWEDVFHTIFYVVIQERATQLNYLNTAIIARGQSDAPGFAEEADPVLANVADTIATDEAAHYYFFLEIARLYLYYYPGLALDALFDVLDNFLMPGYDIIPGRARLGELLYQAGIYGPRQYTRDVLQVALKNVGIEDRRAFVKALSDGIKRSRLAPDPDGNPRHTAIFDLFDYDSVEKAVQKLFGRVADYEHEVGLDQVDPTRFLPSGLGNR